MTKYKNVFIGLSILVATGVAIVMLVVSSDRTDNGGVGLPTPPILDKGWTKGNLNATTTLVEYSDFECPACASYYPILKELNREFGDKVKFVYRHFPLSQIHPNTDNAARASEAAGNQNKFWEMHDFLFENQRSWAGSRSAEKMFSDYALAINLDMELFKRDIGLKETRTKIQNDYKEGLNLGVDSTPTFFLNGKKLKNNPRNYDEFKVIILNALNEQK